MLRKYLLAILLISTGVIASYAKTPTKVACIGNSITYGLKLEDRDTQSYPSQLQQMLGSDYQVANFGRSGATLLRHGHNPYMASEEFAEALAFAPDIAVIHLGINDTDPRNWPNYRDEFVPDYLALIDTLRSVNPDVRILMAQLTPISHRHPRFKSGTRDWRDMIQALIPEIASLADAQVIDFEKPLLAYPHLIPDGIHPNAEGAARLAETVYKAITGNYGGLRMAEIYSDGMVLPHGRTFTIRGEADANVPVDVTIGKQHLRTTSDQNGDWSVDVEPLAAGGPYKMVVTDGKSKLKYNDVLAGEVWLCSGQSNMAFMVKESDTADQDKATADDSMLRLFDMKPVCQTNNVKWPETVLDSINNLQYYRPARWEKAHSGSVADFSAIGYHFGRTLRDSLNIPVGLICNAIGGSPTESWIDRKTLEHEFTDILYDWSKNDFVQPWVRERGTKNISLSENPLQRHPYQPAYLFESGIIPLEKYPISGIAWYQGESNANNIEVHEALFRLLADSWRREWDSSTLPICFVQLSSLNRPSWPWFRDSQRRLADSIPHTYMAVSSDHGNRTDVHPRHKLAVGRRLALQALANVYHHNTVPSGPVPVKAESSDGSIAVTFDHAQGMTSADGGAIRTFEIAETDGLYVPASVKIQGNRIILSNPQIKHPKYVRYGWQPYTDANLVNSSGLPASTFRIQATHK